MTDVALIGLGEVGRILAEDLLSRGARIAAWDVKLDDLESAPAKTAAELTLRAAKSAADAAKDAELVISAVTAAQTVAAAAATTQGIASGAFFLDLNSASPGAKEEAAHAVEAAGGRYIEAAVMSPYPPRRLATPTLLGGPHAETALPFLEELGFTACEAYAETIGKASAAKMCRSVMVKGIEALLTECLLAARLYGVEDEVLASLDDLFPGPDWPRLARYMISRSLEHGVRRAEEMVEVARTVAEAGVAPLMSEATAARQAWAPQFSAALSEKDLKAMLDAIRNALEAEADATGSRTAS